MCGIVILHSLKRSDGSLLLFEPDQMKLICLKPSHIFMFKVNCQDPVFTYLIICDELSKHLSFFSPNLQQWFNTCFFLLFLNNFKVLLKDKLYFFRGMLIHSHICMKQVI